MWSSMSQAAANFAGHRGYQALGADGTLDIVDICALAGPEHDDDRRGHAGGKVAGEVML